MVPYQPSPCLRGTFDGIIHSFTTDSLMFHDLCICLIIQEQKMFEESESLLSTFIFVLPFYSSNAATACVALDTEK